MQAWLDFIKKQEPLLGASSVDKWLRPLKVVHFDSRNLYLEAQDSFQVLWFEEHIRPLIKTGLLNPNGRPILVHITLSDATPTASKKKQPSAPYSWSLDSLDPLMTLDNFVGNKSNPHLLRFFQELLEPSSKTIGSFNPIYIWGEGGCGKTHLLMALTQALQAQGYRPLYAKADTFTEHVVAAIRSSEMHSFRRHYRHTDILLIDDVHLFARKYATQEEFFHTFNTLHTSGRQIILSSRYTPTQLQEIEPRLISRFEWGINLHFNPLSEEDRLELLHQRATTLHFPLWPELTAFLIQTFPTTHALQRALETLMLRSHLDKKEILSLDIAKEMLFELIAREKQAELSPDKICHAVATFYDITLKDLLGKSQTKEHALPRQIAMYLCRKELRLPYQVIGRFFSKDHSTVMTSVKQIETQLTDAHPELAVSLRSIKAQLALFRAQGHTTTS